MKAADIHVIYFSNSFLGPPVRLDLNNQRNTKQRLPYRRYVHICDSTDRRRFRKTNDLNVGLRRTRCTLEYKHGKKDSRLAFNSICVKGTFNFVSYNSAPGECLEVCLVLTLSPRHLFCGSNRRSIRRTCGGSVAVILGKKGDAGRSFA